MSALPPPEETHYYVVERIVDKGTMRGSDQLFYLVKWQGFSDDQNTW